MTWLVLAVATAVLYALQGAWTKRITGPIPRLTVSWGIFAFAFPALATYLGVRGWPALDPGVWPYFAANVGLYVVSFYLFVSALELGELSLGYPLLALTPILVIPVEWVLLGEQPGASGVAGIALAVVGVYALNFRARAGLLDPFRAVGRDPGARRMLLVALLWAVSGTVDRVVVLRTSPAFYGTTVSAAVALAFLPLLRARGERVTDALEDGGWWRLTVQGLLFAGMFVCQMEALRLALASYVLAIKRSGTLLGVLMGWLVFREEAPGRRLAGAVVILAGVVVLAMT